MTGDRFSMKRNFFLGLEIYLTLGDDDAAAAAAAVVVLIGKLSFHCDFNLAKGLFVQT